MTKEIDDLKKAIELAEDGAEELKKSQMSLDFSASDKPHATDWKSKKEKLGDATQAVIGRRSVSAVSLHEINGTHEGATGALIHGGNKYEAVKHKGNWHLTGNYTTNEPHHKEYTRTSRSGKVSQIAAKGPQVNTEYVRPTHVKNKNDEYDHLSRIPAEKRTQGEKERLRKIASQAGIHGGLSPEYKAHVAAPETRQAFNGDPKGLVNDITRKLNITYGNDKTPMQFYVKQDENIVTVGPKAEPVARGAVMSFGSHETMSGQRERWQREAWAAAAPKILAEIKKRINVEDAGIDNGAIYFVSDDMLPKRK